MATLAEIKTILQQILAVQTKQLGLNVERRVSGGRAGGVGSPGPSRGLPPGIPPLDSEEFAIKFGGGGRPPPITKPGTPNITVEPPDDESTPVPKARKQAGAKSPKQTAKPPAPPTNRFGRILGQFKAGRELGGLTGLLGKALTSAGGGAAGASATSAIGAAGPVGAGLAVGLGVLGKMVDIIKKVVIGLVILTGVLYSATKQLAQFNASIAATVAQSEVRGIQRGIRSGQIRAASFARMSDAIEDMKDILTLVLDGIFLFLTPVVEIVRDIFVILLDMAISLAELVPGVGDVEKRLKEVRDGINRDQPKELPLSGLFRDAAMGNLDRRIESVGY